MVCRQLGFNGGAESANCCSRFGPPPSSRKFSYDDVVCVGAETNLEDCEHTNTNDCRSNEVASVVCKLKVTVVTP